MTIKRSYRHLFLGSLGVALLLSNCTVKEDNEDTCEKGDKDVGCQCPGNTAGYQVCGSDGVFGSCICPDGTAGTGNTSGSNTGGSGDNEGGVPNPGVGGDFGSGTAGTSAEAGAGGTAEGGAGGAGGAGGEAPFAFADCDECLETLCAAEWDACLTADDNALCVDQYAAVSDCIEQDRANNNVSRDRLRGCGVTLGASPSSNLAGDWAPAQMTDEATDLINCMATSSSDLPNADWADVSGPSFPDSGPTPWPADSCAKLACTSKK
ncbi:MAG: hypothetical protein EOO73_24695 [Myxococcales bacterium]|nr:MAG: hypothetical protein EOO73_24695 [Myxococcales bacterium]